MSYMRHPSYIWQDGVRIYLNSPPGPVAFSEGEAIFPLELFDELVVMRWAQLTEEELEAAELRAIANHRGNFGCDRLLEDRGMASEMRKLLDAMGDLEADDAAD